MGEGGYLYNASPKRYDPQKKKKKKKRRKKGKTTTARTIDIKVVWSSPVQSDLCTVQLAIFNSYGEQSFRVSNLKTP